MKLARTRHNRLLLTLALVCVAIAAMPARASACSLADHIRSANTNTSVGGCPQGTSHDIITIAEDITLSEALPPIAGTITIEGHGHTISGAGKFRIFDVVSRRLRVKNLTLTEGQAPGDEDGGAIRVRSGAGAIIENASFNKNNASRGGAIAVTGGQASLNILQSSFRSNSARHGAGAILAAGGNVDISGSSFAFNRGTRFGGAIEALNGRVNIANSTFFRNQSIGGGAVSVSGGEARLTHVTMSANLGNSHGDSLYKRGGRLLMRNSIILNASSFGFGSSCEGALDQSVGNMSQDGSCAEAIEGDPMLGRMTGAPAYFPLKDRSPAVDAADTRFCLETDQVGTARPHGDGCDIGAIEATDARPALPRIEPPPPCPLAQKIAAANTDAPAGACPAGKGHDVISINEDITLERELPPITSEITIEGNGNRISGADRFRIFTVSAGSLTIRNLKLTGGQELDGKGGAILVENSASLVIDDSSFTGNKASWGGAIAFESAGGTLSVKNSSFRDNYTAAGGGAILVNSGAAGGGAILIDGGAVDISGSSFDFNVTALFGGAIEVIQGSVSVSNSSFVGNRARQGGAILVGGGETTLTHVTLVNNPAFEAGGSVAKKGGRLIMRNSIVAGGDSAAACVGDLDHSIGNLSQDGTCAEGAAVDPMLDRATGSPGYILLKAGSPAIDAADARFCPATDQVGRARPKGRGCDIGAIEWPAGSPAQPALDAAEQAANGCALTTTHALNFRDRPGGARIGLVVAGATLTATARTQGWFQVEHRGASGWISADYVATEGDC
ncbi:MAG: SH3 domain-containing protein [Chloroflexi bacterium]|nr:SH3 domain-containing protein [Chloroflexota bacterium]